MAGVPRLFDGQTIFCIAGGPSLTREDCHACRSFPVITINDAVRWAPWAPVLYSSDARWWERNSDLQLQSGLKYHLSDHAPSWVERLEYGGQPGIDWRSTHLRSGGHSGYSAINLAAHLVGPTGTIVLLGYDMQYGPDGTLHAIKDHPVGQNTFRPHYWLKFYRLLPDLLGQRDIQILNATRQTAIEGIERVALEDVRCRKAA